MFQRERRGLVVVVVVVCNMHETDKKYIQQLLGEPRNKKSFGRPRDRWEGNM